LLGRHLDHRKEIDLSRRAPWRNCPGSGSGRSEAIFPHALEMDLDCLLDASQCYINGLPRCHAPRQIGHRGSPVTDWVFIDADQILTFSHGFSRLSLACRFTEASVPFGMSRMVQVSLRRLSGGLPLQEKRIDEGFDLSAQDLLRVAGLQVGPMVLHELIGGEQREPPVRCSAGLGESTIRTRS